LLGLVGDTPTAAARRNHLSPEFSSIFLIMAPRSRPESGPRRLILLDPNRCNSTDTRPP